MSAPPPPGSARAFLRTFLVQGSWNYRTMQGCGFAFALLPVLRSVHGRHGEALESAIARHTAHFNAHPYLTALAVGASARMEADEADPATIERFKRAVRGPLGGLGDRLVWVAWLPLALLVGLTSALAGAPDWLPAVLFLSLYNAGHVGLRLWSFRTGLLEGPGVAAALRTAELARLADRLSGVAAFAVGVLVGLGGVEAAVGPDRGWLWVPAGIGALVLGIRAGPSVWRWTSWAVVAVGGVLVAVGAVG